MPLNLIHGPPNWGRAGRIRRALTAVLDREPVLVVPNVDDVDRFQAELCAKKAVLGAEVTTFDGLFRAVATAGGAPPRPGLTAAQRLGAVAAGVAERRPGLRPLRGSASQPGFPVALSSPLEELQGAGLEPAAVEAEAGTLEGSAYLGDVSTLFADTRPSATASGWPTGTPSRAARSSCSAGGAGWWSRPVFIYGFDDLTRNQIDLIRALAAVVEVTVALPHESANPVLEQRTAPLLESLEQIGVHDSEELDADPANTPDAPLLFHLERGFGAAESERLPPDDTLVLLRSAGERGEAEAIAAEAARACSPTGSSRRRSPSSSATRPAAAHCSRPCSSPTACRSRSRRRSRPGRPPSAAHSSRSSMRCSAPAGRPTCFATSGGPPASRRDGSTGSSAASGAPGP